MGEFEYSLRTGNGTQYFVNGDKYEGEFKFGTINGFGKYSYAKDNQDNYDIYLGEFEEDLKHVKGKIVWRNRSIYD